MKFNFNFFNKKEAKCTVELPVKINTLTYNELIEIGILTLDEQDFETAKCYFDKAIEVDQSNAIGYLERSKLKSKIGDKKGAEQDLIMAKQKLDQLDLGFDAYESANSDYDKGDYLSAVKNYNKAISYLPTLTDVYFNRGIAKEMLSDYKGAVEDFTKAIELKATNIIDAYYRRGFNKFYKLNDNEGALFDFTNAIDLNPLEAEYYYRRAKVNDVYNAVKDLNKAVELGLKHADLYFDLYYRKLELEDYIGCVDAMNNFILLEPIDSKVPFHTAFYLRGFMHTLLFENLLALSDFDMAISLNNKYDEAYYWRGMTKNNIYNDGSGDSDIAFSKELGFQEN